MNRVEKQNQVNALFIFVVYVCLVRSNHQSPSHPLRTLVLEQLQNAANGVYSNVNPLFGTTNGPSASTTLNKNLPEQAEKVKEQDPMFGLPTMSHEQLAMAQANW
jgi:hypothetical protein